VVYNLLIDRAKLFHVRRSCIERRRQLKYTNMEPKVSNMSLYEEIKDSVTVIDRLIFFAPRYVSVVVSKINVYY
jgi:hypothetical protein